MTKAGLLSFVLFLWNPSGRFPEELRRGVDYKNSLITCTKETTRRRLLWSVMLKAKPQGNLNLSNICLGVSLSKYVHRKKKSKVTNEICQYNDIKWKKNNNKFCGVLFLKTAHLFLQTFYSSWVFEICGNRKHYFPKTSTSVLNSFICLPTSIAFVPLFNVYTNWIIIMILCYFLFINKNKGQMSYLDIQTKCKNWSQLMVLYIWNLKGNTNKA